ncbi:EGF domain-specific O-linked N-acetylglucosamine transferase-like isoform X1 [Amphibalanus amphitrite]|uniref:EGF domain-specific O-linked N-acetylglucosamine transferase-like isoform X1 n=1 Tax=Amphibalanus amphitrite TaxID=1232801 RepID=UPI001C92592E|nr:EGF domain-specific O-linked N-acetylglucosamine transferase-like isoform X1 [Amphibalanus amphitrite]
MIYSMTAVSLFIFLIAISIQCKGNIVSELALPPEHVPFYVNSHQRFSDGCRRNGSCQLKPYLDQGLCWGYEENCPIFKSYLVPECDGKSKGWAATKTSQLEMYYEQADFGYIKRRMKTMFPLCSPIDSSLDASALNCSSKMEFCRGRNIRLDFRELTKRRGELLRYKMDVLKPGQMAGHCRVDRDRLSSELEFMSALQSWSPEIQHLTQAERPLTGRPECDRVVTTPTYIMKLDASVSMYHHFCDFFNLYASQHLNDSMDGDHPGSFHRDKQILIWENVPYRSAFAPMFQVFSSRPIWSLNDVIGQRVCFKDVVFPLPPRMIFGLFYNTPLVPGCRQSGLFHAFQRHVLHRLGLPLRRTVADDTVRVVWISRQSRHRRVLNEARILKALRKQQGVEVVKAAFTHATPFVDQVRLVSGSDVLVGLHGAGLTHMLLLPDWGAVFELYHCQDPDCYSDLARLRGLSYTTWEKPELITPQNQGEHPELGAHEKFTNYTLDVAETIRLVLHSVAQVRAHPRYRSARQAHEALQRPARDEL